MSTDPSKPERASDVRKTEGEPFGDIVAALDELPAGESLLLIDSFEPEPLYNVLEQRGFEYDPSEPEPGAWHVEIRHV